MRNPLRNEINFLNIYPCWLKNNRTKDGKVIDIEVSWRYNRDNKGGVVGFSSIITDVTERKQAEVVVRESEEKH